MSRKILLGVALLLTNSFVLADDASAILQASTGTWEGELYYLDYQSGQRFGIPMRVEASLTPDGATLVRRLVYTDPGVLVHAINLTTLDRDSGELVEAFFREGKGEIMRAEVTAINYTDEDSWRLVYELDGMDDDRPARIRHTISREGDGLKARKEVRYVDGGPEYFERNGSELTLISSD